MASMESSLPSKVFQPSAGLLTWWLSTRENEWKLQGLLRPRFETLDCHFSGIVLSNTSHKASHFQGVGDSAS